MGNRSFFNLIKQSGLYALGNVAIKLSGLILAPLYLNSSILTVEAYGQFAVLQVFAQICIISVGLGLGTGMLRYVGKEEKAKEQDALPFTAVVATIFLAFVFALVFWSLAGQLAEYFLENEGQRKVIQFLGIYIGCKVVASVPMMLLRIQERAGLYVIAVVLEMIVLIGGIYSFLAQQLLGIEGIYMAYALASGVQVLVLLVSLSFVVKWKFDRQLLKPVLAYGGPLIFMGLAGLVLNAGDRFILKELTTNEVIGKYEWAARLSGVLNLFLVQSFQLAFTILGLKTLGSGDFSLHRRAFRHFSIWSAWAVLCISLFAFDLTAVLSRVGVDEYYLSSAVLVFPLALGAMIYGVFVVINSVFLVVAKTQLISWMVILAAGLNILFNIVLIPYFEAFGAAIATVLAYGILVYLSSRKAKQEIHINYKWSTFFLVVLLITLLFLAGLTTQTWDTLPRIGARLLLVLSYLPLLYLFKIYRKDELEMGWRFLMQKLRRTPS